MLKVKHVFVGGILVALTAGVAALAIISMAATQTLAQSPGQNGDNTAGNADDQNTSMMQNNDDMMTTSTPSSAMMGGMSMLATNSMSMVDGVRITGLDIVDNDEISVNLNYTGTGNAPRVTLVAMTASTTGMMNMMMSQHHVQMMNMNNNMDMMAMNTGHGNSSNNMQSSMMSMHNGVQSGSNVLDSGWESPSTVTIKLEGSSAVSEDEIGHIMVMIFPFAE